MDKPRLVWSPIYLILENQYKIYPIGRIEDIEVKVDEVKRKEYFELIEIIDDIDIYPSLLGIDWDFDNLSILNFKKRQMRFESKDLRVVTPLDLEEGEFQVDPMREDLDKFNLDHFYDIIM